MAASSCSPRSASAAACWPACSARRSFEQIWGLIDKEEPPHPEHREISVPKMLIALAIEGAIFRADEGRARPLGPALVRALHRHLAGRGRARARVAAADRRYNSPCWKPACGACSRDRRCCSGAVAGLLLRLPRHLIAAITGFGAGVLISAVAFELTEEAYAVGGADAVALGLAAGALAFFAGDRYIDRMGEAGRHGQATHPRRSPSGPRSTPCRSRLRSGCRCSRPARSSRPWSGPCSCPTCPEALSSTAGSMAGHAAAA